MRTPFGSYWIDRKVAVGGMAEIYHAFDAHEHEVAIKKIHPDLASQEKFIQMFLDEVRIVIQLNHPNIVQLLDFGLAEGAYFFSMEWIDGKSLSEINVAQKKMRIRFPVDVAMWMIKDVCEGLHYAHQKQDRFKKPMNLVHRDVSPPNIMATRDGVFKVADFGIAHVRDKNVRTQPGIIRGKFSYMSPEQSLGKPLDHRSDIFSAGVVLHEVLADTRLFLRKNEIDTLDAVRKCEVPSIKQKRPDVPGEVEVMIKKSLSQAASARYRTALEMAESAETVLRERYPKSTRADIITFFSQIFPQEKFASQKTTAKKTSRSNFRSSLYTQSAGGGTKTVLSGAQNTSSILLFVADFLLAHRYWISTGLGLGCLFLIEYFI
ncbi:MAG: serine/threonine protein kinase [Bdellovibrionales bacterium]|nr:serine/threonine protein kinase [Bdellovibrionales bacterium]